MQPTILAGVNFVLHAAGWLEGGLTMGYEKFVMDLDQCGIMHAFVNGVDLSENGQAVERDHRERAGAALPGHGPHPRELRDRFLPVVVADNNSFEQWESEGSKDAVNRANAIWKKMLAEYEPRRSTRRWTRSSASGSSAEGVVPRLERVRSARWASGIGGRDLGRGGRGCSATLVSGPKFELIPLLNALERAASLPPGATVTVTSSPSHGIEATIELAEERRSDGTRARSRTYPRT